MEKKSKEEFYNTASAFAETMQQQYFNEEKPEHSMFMVFSDGNKTCCACLGFTMNIEVLLFSAIRKNPDVHQILMNVATVEAMDGIMQRMLRKRPNQND